MLKITNKQSGPRGVNAVGGPVLVDVGQTIEAKVYAREREHLDASGWFEIEGSYEPDPGAKRPDVSDEDDTTAEGAALREQFNASWSAAAKRAGAGEGESLTDAIDRLVGNNASAVDFEGKLRDALALEEGEGIIEAIESLKAKATAAGQSFAVLEKGRGWFAIVQRKEVTKSLREDDVKGFAELSDADKAAFVDLHKPE